MRVVKKKTKPKKLKRKQNKKLIILACLAFALFVCLVGYLWYQKNTVKTVLFTYEDDYTKPVEVEFNKINNPSNEQKEILQNYDGKYPLLVDDNEGKVFIYPPHTSYYFEIENGPVFGYFYLRPSFPSQVIMRLTSKSMKLLDLSKQTMTDIEPLEPVFDATGTKAYSIENGEVIETTYSPLLKKLSSRVITSVETNPYADIFDETLNGPSTDYIRDGYVYLSQGGGGYTIYRVKIPKSGEISPVEQAGIVPDGGLIFEKEWKHRLTVENVNVDSNFTKTFNDLYSYDVRVYNNQNSHLIKEFKGDGQKAKYLQDQFQYIGYNKNLEQLYYLRNKSLFSLNIKTGEVKTLSKGEVSGANYLNSTNLIVILEYEVALGSLVPRVYGYNINTGFKFVFPDAEYVHAVKTLSDSSVRSHSQNLLHPEWRN